MIGPSIWYQICNCNHHNCEEILNFEFSKMSSYSWICPNALVSNRSITAFCWIDYTRPWSRYWTLVQIFCLESIDERVQGLYRSFVSDLDYIIWKSLSLLFNFFTQFIPDFNSYFCLIFITWLELSTLWVLCWTTSADLEGYHVVGKKIIEKKKWFESNKSDL